MGMGTIVRDIGVAATETAGRNKGSIAEKLATVWRWINGYKKVLKDEAGNVLHNAKTGAVETEKVGAIQWIKTHKTAEILVGAPVALKFGLVDKFSDFMTGGHGVAPVVVDTAGKIMVGSENWNNGKQKVAEWGKDGEALLADMQERFKNLSDGMQKNITALMNSHQQAGMWTPEQVYNANLMMSGAQMTGPTGPLKGWGYALGSGLEQNAWNLASLLPAAWMLFGRHGLLLKAAGMLLGGWSLNKMNLSMFRNPSQQYMSQQRQITPQEYARLMQSRGMSPQDAMTMAQPAAAPAEEEDETVVRARHM